MDSVWSASISDISKKQKRLEGSIKTDVLIIGGGMAGILTAYRLKEAGVNSIIAEAKSIGDGTTKNTTAKITAQHGLVYDEIIKRYGLEKARQYYAANIQAVEDFRVLSERYSCDFEAKTSFVYTTEKKEKLEREANAYQKLGIPVMIEDRPPLPIPTQGALGMEKQAQFNPLKLLYALAEEHEIYENTFIHRIENQKAITDNGSIIAKHIVLATHYPLINIVGLYFMKLYQHRSYCIALENAPYINGMYVDEMENGLSFRNYKDLLFIGGGDHKTGKRGGGHGELRTLTKSAYPSSVEKYYWATQDCMSLDHIPYIGRHSSGKRPIYVATGFNKWGMTSSMIAAGIIRDLIINGKSEYEALYSPQRSMFTKQLVVNIVSAAAGLLSIGSPRCSHMGCKLKWNNAEKTWDCSCHGSRFDKRGNVIDNPAKKDLKYEAVF